MISRIKIQNMVGAAIDLRGKIASPMDFAGGIDDESHSRRLSL